MNILVTALDRPRLARLDVAGSVLSTLCAIHCLAMPLVAGLLPVLGLGFLDDRAFERAACVAMTALAAFCLLHGCQRHRRWWLLALLGAGASLTLGTQFLIAADTAWACVDACCSEGVNWSQALVMFAGGGMIAAAHLLNLRFGRACGCCAKSSETLTGSGGVRAWTSRETPRRRTGRKCRPPFGTRPLVLLMLVLSWIPNARAQPGFAVLEREHTDFRILYEPAGTSLLSLVARDADRGVNLTSNEVILVAREASRLTLPAGTPFGDAGAPLWVLPQSQNVNLLYLGVSAEGVPAGVFDGAVGVRLKRIDGPGYLMAWQATGPGQFNIRLNTRDGLSAADAFTPLIGSHEHFNWGFSTTGVYSVTFQVVARRNGESTNITSPETTFVFHVQPVPPPTNFIVWQRSIWPPGFNPPITDPEFDADGDGAPNLLEYATGSSPTNATSMNGSVSLAMDGEAGAAMSFIRYLPALDVEWEPQATTALDLPWEVLTRVTGFEPLTPLTARATFGDDAPVISHGQRFYQLKVRLR